MQIGLSKRRGAQQNLSSVVTFAISARGACSLAAPDPSSAAAVTFPAITTTSLATTVTSPAITATSSAVALSFPAAALHLSRGGGTDCSGERLIYSAEALLLTAVRKTTHYRDKDYAQT